MEQAKSEFRGDPVVPRTSDDDTRDKESASLVAAPDPEQVVTSLDVDYWLQELELAQHGKLGNTFNTEWANRTRAFVQRMISELSAEAECRSLREQLPKAVLAEAERIVSIDPSGISSLMRWVELGTDAQNVLG